MKQPKSTKGIKIDVRRFKSINDSSLDYFDVKPTYIQPNERYGLDQKVIKRLYDLRKYLDDTLLFLAKKEGEYEVYKKQLSDLEKQKKNLDVIKFDLENQKILIKALYSVSKTQLDKIENLCTVALRDILQDNTIQFKIKMEETKRGIDTYFYTVSSSGENDIMQSEAGGVKNILSVCLRLIFTEFCTPKIEGPIILDEVGANISAEYQNNFAEFLRQFSEKNNRQIILISHIQAARDKAPCLITIYKKENQSYIQEVE